MADSNSGYYPRASSSKTATFQGHSTASPTVEPPRSQGAAGVSESRRSSGSTQSNASPPEPTAATNTPPPPPCSDSNASPTKGSSDPCKCCPTDSAERKSRNLVICIDGTANEFGITNTNVIELYGQILREESDELEQLTYYNSGIGTYAMPSWKSWSHLTQVIQNKIDLVIAWNVEKVIMRAYQWLSHHYQKGDKIFLFGFSRGAFQVRALAGMIDTVGLILPGNDEQIPFAYQHYVNYDATAGKDEALAPKFKQMFSRTNVRVHFIGVWDTVSSVGLMRPKHMLPRIVDCCDHVCYFRHALALDERRVKFLPEYVHEGSSHTLGEQLLHGPEKCTANIKEVWFTGTHSDVRVNTGLQLADIPLLWMRNQAIMAGLHLKAADITWKLTDLERDPKPSLGVIWKVLEYFPVKRLSYKGDQDATTRRLHRGKSRKIVEGQMIHASVLFRPGYKPSPAFPNKTGTWPAQLHWDDPDRQARLAELDIIWEKDLIDHTAAKDLFTQLERNKQNIARILERIAFMASSGQLRLASLNDPHSHRVILEQRKVEKQYRKQGSFLLIFWSLSFPIKSARRAGRRRRER
ncbi:hypothetical protein FIBSPDRAFT_743308 [Athelia psychrophila]|uniref:T6SS Phospholipase effector Tle1-like catalytic domain-containing protein n=1 Tax=Athelia psychrophila TaxID=1759441 RepID=A0A166IHV3_9AGAM|nr:hypothetical protein FIBSPDRAFT_743308 [Fibularhizoctonia sp. CBS 109695]